MNIRKLAQAVVWMAGIVGILGSGGASNKVPIPQFTWAPQSPAVGELVTFDATGTYDDRTAKERLQFSWDFENDGLPDATGIVVTHRFTSAGSFQVSLKVTDDEEDVSFQKTGELLQRLTVVAAAPVIDQQPQDISVVAGATANFVVQAVGTAPLNYQWRRNGADIAGATGSSHTTAATTVADTGSQYSVVVTNGGGSVTSRTALLTVTAASAGGSWRALQLASVDGNATQRRMRSVAINQAGEPFVAFREGTQIRVMRSDGNTWTSVGGALNSVASESGTPSIDLDAAGLPVVAWTEGPFANSDVRAARWNGSTWVALGAEPLDDLRANHARMPDVDVGPSGPVVAWIEGDRVIVKRWANPGWTGFGGADVDGPVNSDVVSMPSIAVDGAGNVFVAWNEFLTVSAQAIRVARGNAAGWTTLGPEVNTGGTAELSDAPRMQLALGADGVPVVAYGSFTFGQGLQVRRWDAANNAWPRLGQVLGNEDATRRVQSVALDIAAGSNEPLLAWHDSGIAAIRVLRYIGAAWVPVGPNDPALLPVGVINVAAAAGARPVVLYNSTVLGQTVVDGFRYEP